MSNKRLRRKEGDIFRIELEEHLFGFCQVMSPKACVCFFRKYVDDPNYDVTKLEDTEVLFKLFINDSAFRNESWVFIRKLPIFSQASELPYFFRKEIGSQKYIKFTYGDHIGSYITKEVAISERLLSGGSFMANHIKDLMLADYRNQGSIWCKNLYP